MSFVVSFLGWLLFWFGYAFGGGGCLDLTGFGGPKMGSKNREKWSSGMGVLQN